LFILFFSRKVKRKKFNQHKVKEYGKIVFNFFCFFDEKRKKSTQVSKYPLTNEQVLEVSPPAMNKNE
jgi:hypothetical protein